MLNTNENEQPLQQDCIRVETHLNALTQVLEWFEQFNQPPLSYDLWVQGKIALIEGFTNVVRHAHRNLPQLTPIELAVKVFSNKVEIYIWDEGPAFDLGALLSSSDREDFNPLDREAHWGGILMQKLRSKHGWIINYTCPASSTTHQNLLLVQKMLN